MQGLADSTLKVNFDMIVQAKQRIAPYIHETPLEYSNTISRMTGSSVFLKMENLQKTGSFKARGALNKIISLPKETRGVVAISAGNHAQGVAYAANIAGMKSVIVMPETAPFTKILATRSYGAEVILYGKYLHESSEKGGELMRKTGYVLVHPYNDPEVIAGQGTLGLELLSKEPDVVFVPIGGGGLISGVAVALKSRNPKVKIIGVQSIASPSLKASRSTGKLVQIEPSFSIADGILVKNPSPITSEIINELVDDIVLVDDDEISQAMVLLLERAKTVVEGAGAASVAAILSGKVDIENKKTIAVLSGGNVDLTLLTYLVNRSLHKDKRIIKLKVSVPDKPGYLNTILEIIARIKGNVIDVVHDRYSPNVRPGHTDIYVTFELRDHQVLTSLLGELEREGIQTSIIE